MPRLSDYHVEMHHLVFSKRTGASLNHHTASILVLELNYFKNKKKELILTI